MSQASSTQSRVVCAVPTRVVVGPVALPAAAVGVGWLCAAALLASLAGCAPGDRHALLERRVESVVAPLVAAHEFSGAIVLTRDGQEVFRRGYGMANHDAGAAFTPDTPSDGGSLAKTFTAAALQWLAHEGRVDLDAPVSRYLPEFPHAGTTLRHLISHSNGLPPDYAFFDAHFAPTEVRTTEAMLRVLARTQPTPAFAPGSRFEYSNFAWDLAALVIERVTGRPYETVLRERFFARLSMQASFARPARFADWQGIRTLGYRWEDGRWTLVDVFDLEAFLGASNLYFPAADLARWAGANAVGTALPAAVVAAGQQRPLIDGRPSAITGLSWYCDEGGVRCHYTGDINAFHGFAYWDRARNESAAFVSNSSLPPWQIVTLQRALVDALAERPPAADAPPQTQVMTDTTWPAVAGTYVGDGIGALRITHGTEGFRVRIDDGLTLQAFPVSSDVLFVPGSAHWLAFSGGMPPAVVHVRSMYVDATARRAATPGADNQRGRAVVRIAASQPPT